MMNRSRYVLGLINEISREPADDHSLAALARRARRSPFRLQRAFRALVRETPKQYTLRVRLDRAAASLVASDAPILHVALEAGFNSHEVFTRAFRRRFGCSPERFRKTTLNGAARSVRRRHAAVVGSVSPCIGLFHFPHSSTGGSTMPTSPIERRHIDAEPILFIRRQVSRAELPAMLGECLGAIFMHCQRAGLALAGQPFARYPTAGPGLLTVEAGMRLAAPASGEGEIHSGFLAEGAVAVAMHAGPYDQLGETYAAIERWIGATGVAARGAPWEVYVTDPAEHPNPADWRTEVFWPIAD